MVTINYTFSKEDYFNYYYYALWQSPSRKTAIIKSWCSKFLLFSCYSVIVHYFTKKNLSDMYFLFSISLLFCIFIIPLLTIAKTYRKDSDTFVNNPVNAHLFSDYEYIISETGIITKVRFASAIYQWQAIVKKEENNDYYFLFLDTHQALIIPKRAVKNEAKKIQLEKIFAQYISFEAEVGHLVKE